MKQFFIGLFFACIGSAGWSIDPPELRAIYVANFDCNTQAKCDTIIANVTQASRLGRINSVFVEVRGRADAYYIPNREDSTYPNPEPRGQQYVISPADLDVLQYFIDRLHATSPRIEVHAWLTTFNSWSSATPPANPNHVYNLHPEWITESAAGVTYTHANDAPLDPGIPAVQDYLYNVFMDVVRNYDIDGIHFDYVRLLGADSGYDPVAKAAFLAQTGWNFDTQNGSGRLNEVYEAWRRDQISKIVQRIYNQSMLEKPWVEVSAFLVNFSDSVEVLAQGYNWWVAHNAIDVLHPGCYAADVAGTEGDYNFILAKLAQNGDQNKRQVVCAVGDYLLTDPNENAQAVTSIRANARTPNGFNFFDYGSLFVDFVDHDNNLFDTGGPMDDVAPVPAMAHKPAEETTPPNAPAAASVSLFGGIPRTTFSRPAAAGDGDLPVHYRLYRDTQNPPRLYYSNMAMEWWDLTSSRASFQYDDGFSPAGTIYYAVVAYDNWNNEARTNLASIVVPSAGSEYIIETRAGGQHIADYQELAGHIFSNSSSHSTAAGCTAGIGSRFAVPGDANGRADKVRFVPSGLLSGSYQVYITCIAAASSNAQNITIRKNDSSGLSVVSTTFDLDNATAGSQWAAVSTFNFVAGSGHYVEFSNESQTNIGDSTNSRFNPAACRLVRTDLPPKEPKPPVAPTASSATELIVDSSPQALDYDDGTGWADSGFGLAACYNGNVRFESAINSTTPPATYAVWVADLPRAGYWAIDGWVRKDANSPGFAGNAQYRFVDGTGVVRSVETSQRSATSSSTEGDWLINVDGAADPGAFPFQKGRVYVTIHGNNNATAQSLMADALRFRYTAYFPVTISSFLVE